MSEGRQFRRAASKLDDLFAQCDQFVRRLFQPFWNVLVGDAIFAELFEDGAEWSDLDSLLARDLGRKLFELVRQWLLRLGDALPNLLLVEADGNRSIDNRVAS